MGKETLDQIIRDLEASGVSVYSPLPWQREFIYDLSPIVLCTGSAGGGKSRAALEKAHMFANKYPGANILLIRKVKDTALSSIVPTMDQYVIGLDSNTGIQKNVTESKWSYPNGSTIWWWGMKDASKRTNLRSIGAGGQLDMVIMEEAIEFEEADFNEIMGRMRGTAVRTYWEKQGLSRFEAERYAWTQVTLLTNPGPRMHWINVRLILGGESSVHYSAAQDNTYLPGSYLHYMQTMRGVEAARLVRGLWIDGEGLVLDRWSDDYNAQLRTDKGGNVTLSAEYTPGAGPVYMAIDDGYSGSQDEKTGWFSANSHPRAILLVQERSDGQLAVFYENLAIETLSRDQLNQVFSDMKANNWPAPARYVHDARAKAIGLELRRLGRRNIRKGTSDREESIKLLNSTVAKDHNGRRGLIVHPRCMHMRNEMSSWVYMDDKPIKAHDHTIDALRYLVADVVGGVPSGVDYDGGDVVSKEVAEKVQNEFDRIDKLFDKIEREMDAKFGSDFEQVVQEY